MQNKVKLRATLFDGFVNVCVAGYSCVSKRNKPDSLQKKKDSNNKISKPMAVCAANAIAMRLNAC